MKCDKSVIVFKFKEKISLDALIILAWYGIVFMPFGIESMSKDMLYVLSAVCRKGQRQIRLGTHMKPE